MNSRAFSKAEAPAGVLALIVSADGSVSERALGVLDRLGAFGLLGVSRERFFALAHDCTCRIDPSLCERSWLTDKDIAQTAAIIDGVRRPEDRNLVCRLAAAAIEDGGLVTHGARLMFDHVLARWQIDLATLSPAVL